MNVGNGQFTNSHVVTAANKPTHEPAVHPAPSQSMGACGTPKAPYAPRRVLALGLLSWCICISTSDAFQMFPKAAVRPMSGGHFQHSSSETSRFERRHLARMTLDDVSTSHSSMNAFDVTKLSLALMALFVFAPPCTASAPDLSHTPLARSKVNLVVEGHPRIVDGDTLVFEQRSGEKERVRLLGIDAPESKQMCTNKNGKEYACGVESKAFLETIIGSDPVQCLAAKRDQYSRVLGVCFDEKTGKELNEAMVVNGEAVAYVQFSKAYVEDENQAMNAHKGLWQGQFQKPWEYRKMKRSKAQTKKPTTVTNYVLSENKKVKMAKTEFELPEDFLDAEDAE